MELETLSSHNNCTDCRNLVKPTKFSAKTSGTVMLLVLLAITICQAGQIMSQCSNCQECDTYGRCKKCTEGFVLVANNCVKCNIQNCRSCSEQGKCDICEAGYYTSIYSNYVLCYRCPSSCTSCSSWNECLSCANEYVLSDGLCIDCTLICDSCFQRGTCNNCKDGYYVTSNQGCSRCKDNCTTCWDQTNCQSCKHGYYLQNLDCIKCPQHCETCSSETICDSCKVGYYLNTDLCMACRKECVDCIEHDICVKCLPRYYLSSRGVCEACPGTCSSCTSGDACRLCDKGYYGTICERTCSGLCKDQQCRQSNGVCDSGCISGYYRDYWTGFCNECPDYCETCSSIYSCDTCKIGFYGHRCSNKCPEECSSRECKKVNGDCSKGCVVGYYGYRCNYNCSEGCSGHACFKGYGTCMNGCIDGYYGTTCQRCSEFCINRQCEIYGRCTTGCIDGYYAREGQCYKCPENCQTCSSDALCTSCIDGFYTLSCKTPCINCLQGGCSFQNGICTNGCRVGFYQAESSCLHCPGNCAKCTSKEYCDVCQYGYFGEACEHKCPFYCLPCDGIDSCSACNKETGHCMNCTYDTFGQFCDHNCSTNCFRTSHTVSSCFQQNGTCLYGCVKGFTGYNCTEEIASSEQHTMVPEITAMTLGGVVFLVLAATGLILLVRRRRNKETKSPRHVDSDSQHATCTMRNPTYNAASGNDEIISSSDVKPDAADHVYAVVQKKCLRNQTSEIDQSIADDNVYDVSSTDKPPARIQLLPKTETKGDNTYSHINHVNKAGRLDYGHHIDGETVYDHVAYDLVHPGNEMTYDIARSNQGQPCDEITGMMRAPTSQVHGGGMNDEEDTYSHTIQQLARRHADHAI